MVVLRLFDLSGQIPLGFQTVTPDLAHRAESIAKAQGREKVTLRDLDLAQAEAQDLDWASLQFESSRWKD